MFNEEPGQECGNHKLASLVKFCLGRPLCKSEAFSNWERRPLRKAQENYAAKHAFCLLETFGALVHICWNQHIRVESVCPQVDDYYNEFRCCTHCFKPNHKVIDCPKRWTFEQRMAHQFEETIESLNYCIYLLRRWTDDIDYIDCDRVVYPLENIFSKCFIKPHIVNEIYFAIDGIIENIQIAGNNDLNIHLDDVLENFNDIIRIIKNLQNQQKQFLHSNPVGPCWAMCTYCFRVGHLDIYCDTLNEEIERIRYMLSNDMSGNDSDM